MKKIILSALVLISFQTFAGGGSSVGPANPASMNCKQLGGTLEIVNSEGGQYGMCTVDEWKLFHEMNARGLVKDHDYGVGMPNPASVNCTDIGGMTIIQSGPYGQTGYCQVEEWTLFRAIDVVTGN